MTRPAEATVFAAIDFGTCNTVAVLHRPDDGGRPILFDGAPLLPSAVYAGESGEVYVGRDAIHMSRLDPVRYEPNPKRRIDEGNVLLGGRAYPVVDVVAAVLSRVAQEIVRTAGRLPPVVLTCPAGWGAPRRGVLSQAAARAGLTVLEIVSEPVAAAAYFTTVLGNRMSAGQLLTVFDFGGGTLDVAVVGRSPAGLRVAGSGGLDDLGGLDLDAAVVDHIADRLADAAPAAWARLAHPTGPEQLRDRALLWQDARSAKEILSRSSSAPIHVPGYGPGTHLTRDEFEHRVHPMLDRAVRVTEDVLRAAGVGVTELAGVFLVGGSSRTPLVARLLHERLGVPPTVLERPETAVAEGALRQGSAARLTSTVAALGAAGSPDPATTPSGEAPVLERPRRRRWLPAVAVAVLLVLGLTGYLLVANGLFSGIGGPATPGHTATPGGTGSPRPALSYAAKNPSDLARSDGLQTLTAPWGQYPWASQGGCRRATDAAHRPNGKLGNPAGGAAVADPLEVVHCHTQDFDVMFARFRDGQQTNSVARAYCRGGSAASAPAGLPQRLRSDTLCRLDRWGTDDNRRALAWMHSASQASMLGVLVTGDATQDLVAMWQRYSVRR